MAGTRVSPLKARPAVPRGLPPLVFLGPSAPVADVRALLPEAEIRPPLRRGDLYLARLLRYSVFLVFDGVFAQEEAVSPREVVHVLADGAAVVGAASMGALRAVDCAPAGAEGIGAVYRLFRSGAVNSENEVAVLFLPEQPFPAVTEALVNIRFALRAASRRWLITAEAARRLFDAASGIPYDQRTWRAIFARAGMADAFAALAPALGARDVKRADVRRALAVVARRLAAAPAWGERPRASRSDFGVNAPGRERPYDPLLGAGEAGTAPGFLAWMLASGRAGRCLPPDQISLKLLADLDLRLPSDTAGRLDNLAWDEIAPGAHDARRLAAALGAELTRRGELDAERFRHMAVAAAARAQGRNGQPPSEDDLGRAGEAMAAAHGAASWPDLEAQASPLVLEVLRAMRDTWALGKSFRRSNAFASLHIP